MSKHKSFKSLELVVIGLLMALIAALAFPVLFSSHPVSPATQVEVLNP